ncbi:MAG: hypothetical protein WBN10_20100 [Polyangiales bacterium]
MKSKSSLLLALALVAVACGDDGAPYYGSSELMPVPGDDSPPPASGDPESLPAGWHGVDLHSNSAIKLNAGDCWKPGDCETGESCMHSEFFLTRSDTPGACMPRPAGRFVGLIAVSPVRFTDGGGSPATDDFVVESGVFDGTLMVDQDGNTQAFDAIGISLPFNVGGGFEFSWQLGVHIRVVDPNDPGYDIECNLAFLRSGDVVGGVVRESGKLLCSTNNWQSPQNPGAPGLLIEYEQCAWSEAAWTGSYYCPLD